LHHNAQEIDREIDRAVGHYEGGRKPHSIVICCHMLYGLGVQAQVQNSKDLAESSEIRQP
jgi:hypothetical protein